MEKEDRSKEVFRKLFAEKAIRERDKLNLRQQELKLYRNFVTVYSQRGALNDANKKLIGDVRASLGITEERHAAECRRVVSDPEICGFSERLHGRTAMEVWKKEGYGNFPPLPTLIKRCRIRECVRKEVPVGPGDLKAPAVDGVDINDISDTEEYQFAKSLWSYRARKVDKKVQTAKIAIKHSKVRSSDDESINEKIKQDREQSPDITETPTTPNKHKVTLRNNASMKRARGAKRKLGSMSRSSPVKVEPPLKIVKKSIIKQPSGRPLKLTKTKHPKIKFVRRRPPDSSDNESRSSDDEITVKNDLIRTNLKISAPTINTRGRGLSRVRGRGTRGRGSGRGRPSNVIASPNSPTYLNIRNEYTHSPPHPYPHPLQQRPEISPERIHHHHHQQHHPALNPPSPTKTLKVLKPKKPKVVSVSRRKSRLKEKEDDEMQMEWNDNYDEDALIMSNRRMPIKKRKNFSDGSFNREAESDGDSGLRDRDEGGVIDNIHEIKRQNGMSEEQLHDDREIHDRNTSRTIEIFGRPESSRNSGGTLSGEETDSASEKGSISGSRCNDSPNSINSKEINSSNNNNNNGCNTISSNSNSNSNTNSRVSTSPPPAPPTRQKQRLKTPLTSNPQLPRITLPPPVFSTSLSNVQKKRPPKPMSVVDSLNLHLPTTPTASSLAASSSSRRPSIMGGSGSSSSGCSIFSNSQALLANSRGGPGILQQQRKAHPHILANSKVNQRTFLPNTSNNSNNNLSLGVGVSGSTINLPSNNSIVASSSGTIMSPNVGVHHQVQTTVIPSIPVSSGTAVTMQLPGSSGSPLTMSGAIPIGSVPVSRTPGTNIIFLQKTNPPTVVTSSIGLSSNSLPVKAPSRAVILRRAPLPLPRQGNVMILDVQKNQMVAAGQVPQFLQTTRILTGPSELSMLNLQGNHAPRKIIQAQPTDHSDTTPVVYSVPSGQQRKTKLVGAQQAIVSSVPSTFSTTTTFRPAEQTIVTSEHQAPKDFPVTTASISALTQKDSQLAQIEAELMQMEQGIVYEEEVVTSTEMMESISSLNQNSASSSYQIPAPRSTEQVHCNVNSTISNSVPVGNLYVTSSSTDTASEGEASFSIPSTTISSSEGVRQKSIEISLSPKKEIRQMSDAVTRAIVSSSNVGQVGGIKNTSLGSNTEMQLPQSQQQSNFQSVGEDIFKAALESSGIVFAEQFYGAEEEISTNIEESTSQAVAVANHCTNSSQGNGTALQ